MVEDGFAQHPTKPVKKQPKFTKLAVRHASSALAVLDSIVRIARHSCSQRRAVKPLFVHPSGHTKPVERLERGAPAVRAR